MNKKKSLLGALLLSLTSCSYNTYNYKDSNLYTEYSSPLTLESTVKYLNISWVSGNVEIIEGDNFVLTEKNEKGDYLPLYYYIDNSTLNVHYVKNGTYKNVYKDMDKKLIITVPQNVLREIKLDTVASTYSINYKDLEKFELDTVSGIGSLSIDTIKYIDISSVSGNINCTIKDTSKTEEIKVKSTSGNTFLTLDDTRGYDLDYSSLSGNVIQEFKEPTNKLLDEYKINVEVLSGNVIIKKYQK